jgi:CheY-like chemotaxis protein
VELLRASFFLGDRYPKNPPGFYLSEGETDENSPTQPRILVVDDERLLADTTAAILRRAGYTSKTAYDALTALATMASFHPDYLLTDIMMPGMNGVELAIAITRIHPATKILLFSGQAGISEILEDSKAKGFEFPLLAKPVHPTKLIEGLLGLEND